MDTFLGPYKDGTQPGTVDCRRYAIVLLITRFLFMVFYASTLDISFFSFAAMLLSVVAGTIVIVDPYKSKLKYFSSSMFLFILFMAVACVCCIVRELAERSKATTISSLAYGLVAAIGSLPLVCVSVFILLSIISSIKSSTMRVVN